MGILRILMLSGDQDTGNIGEENGFGFRVTGINVRSLTPSGSRGTGNQEEGAGCGFRDVGSIGK
jgi:hypothetical protein